MTDGSLLPSAEGATRRFLETARLLKRAGHDVTLIHAFRGWSDWRLLAAEPYRVVLVHPDDFYRPGRVLGSLFGRLDLHWLQAKDPVVITALRRSRVLPAETGLLFECHDLPPADAARGADVWRAAAIADRIVCLEADEARALAGWADAGRRVFHLPCTLPASASRPRVHAGHGHRITFLGNFYYEPNFEAAHWIASELLPLVRRHVGDAEIHMLGDVPQSAACDRRPGVVWRGVIPEQELVSTLAENDLALSIVLRGTGFRVKVLHYMAAGLPVVGNRLGLTGVGVRRCFAQAERAEELAAACVRLLADAAGRTRAATSAQRLLRRDFSNESLVSRYDEVLRPLAVEERRSLPPDDRGITLDGPPAWLDEFFRKHRFPSTTSPLVTPGSCFDLTSEAERASLAASDLHHRAA